MKSQIAALLVGAAVLGLNSAAHGQTIYPGVQYQYGQYGEIFYGGQNPNILNHPYLYVPPQLLKSVNPMYTGPSYYYGPPAGGYLGTLPENYGAYPATRFNQQFYSEPPRIVLSDIAPYTEVGQYGYTESDAHNEAYANVPRFTVKNPQALLQKERAASEPAPAAPPAVQQTAEEKTQAQQAKALPLLNWAKAEHARGHDRLVDMLVSEAAKFDPAAAGAFRSSMQASANER